MEIKQKYILHGFGKIKITALDDKVICEFKSLFSDYIMEHNYVDIDTHYIKGKASNNKWSDVGWFFVIVLIFLTPFIRNHSLFFYVSLPILFIALASFAMLLRKQEYISFTIRSSGRHFSIIKPSQHKEFVDYLIGKIEKANQKQ